MAKEWTLITTLDDYSRLMLYADFVEHDTTWAHIKALESVVLNYGVPVLWYVDNHSSRLLLQLPFSSPQGVPPCGDRGETTLGYGSMTIFGVGTLVP